MGRHVGRSRGCQVCIKRRIKCDETLPECNECVSSGRKCDGPLQGTLFVDMSAKIRQSVDSSSDSDSKKKKRPKPKVVLYGTADKSTIPRPAKPQACSSEVLKLPKTYQPPRGDIFQQHYIAHFVNSHEPCVHSWASHLPDLITSPHYSPEVYAIRATSMAFYGKLSGREDLEIEATKWYSKGLESQRKHLEAATQSEENRLCTKKAVCAAIMFSHFETIICTNPLSWIHHYNAAGKLLELCGPEQCQNGLLHMFFRTMRLASFTTSMIADEPSTFASEPWCKIPFLENTKTPFDHLVDILLQLPSCLPVRNEMRSLRDSDPITSEILRLDLGTTASHIFTRLITFWDVQKPLFDPDYDSRIEELIALIKADENNQESLPTTYPFRSSFAAYFASMYDAGSIIALSHLAAASLCSDVYKWQMILHGASILASVSYYEAQGSSSTASFSMIFPVKLVCLLSPSEVQRGIAQDTLVKWGAKRGLDEICNGMEPSYVSRRHGLILGE